MNTNDLETRLERMSAQLEFLVERQRKQEELFAEMSPILREAMRATVAKLDVFEKKGWFRFGAALGEVGERILEHYTAEDVQALGGAIVTILDTVRALTQPEVMAILGEAGHVLQHADDAKPIGLLGMVRASRHEDVQKGMAVLMELLRHVGRATQAVVDKDVQARDRKARLASTLGPRRKKALGIERTVVAPAPPRGDSERAASPRPDHAATAASTKPAAPAVVIDGVTFTVDGHLVDPASWTRELGESIAALEGVTLTAVHWKLIETARADFEEKRVAANIRRLTQIAGVTTKDIYGLFPKAPGRTIAKIAGTPKPAGCI